MCQRTIPYNYGYTFMSSKEFDFFETRGLSARILNLQSWLKCIECSSNRWTARVYTVWRNGDSWGYRASTVSLTQIWAKSRYLTQLQKNSKTEVWPGVERCLTVAD